MWPWGHAALGYLCYRIILWIRNAKPTHLGALALGVGTQFPDLIDKPLAWTFDILPSGRSLGHSLITATILLLIITALSRRYGHRRVGHAFAIGYLSHLLGDALLPLLNGNWVYLGFLGWPILPIPPYQSNSGILAHLANISLTPMVVNQLIFGLLMVALWIHDGTPGLKPLLRLLPDAWRRTERTDQR